VVVNEDIARLMRLANHSKSSCLDCFSDTSVKDSKDEENDLSIINLIEGRLLNILSFQLYVSPQEYNEAQTKLNSEIK